MLGIKRPATTILGAGTAIYSASDDCNDLPVGLSRIGYQVQHGTGDTSLVFTARYGTSAIQIAYKYSGSVFYIRGNAGTWTEWHQI